MAKAKKSPAGKRPQAPRSFEALKKAYDGRFDDCSAAVFVVVPPEGRIVSVNTEAEELTAYEKAELETMNLADIFRDEDRLRIASIFDQSSRLEFRKLFEHNVIVRKRSKRKIFVDMGFKRATTKGHDAIIFTLQDITDLKNNEERVVRANEYVNGVINSMIEIMLVADDASRIQSLNATALQLLGYPEEAVIGKPVAMLFPEFQTGAELAAVREFSEIETHVRARDGRLVPVLVSKSALKLSRAGEGGRSVIVAMDISERKKAERLIAEQQSVIVQASKMSSLGEMASSIAHEINNPLHILLGRAELLGMTLEELAIANPEILEGLAHIERMGQRIQKIVKGLQALARDQSQDAMETVDVAAILKDTLSFCEQRIRMNVGELRLPALDAPVPLRCRATQISQVLLNLLNNSYDEIARTPDSWIRIDVSVAGDDVEIAVTDSGKGIPPAAAAKLFMPFFTTKPVGKGTGIGLSVSKALIEAHGGTLQYDGTAPNTRFVIRLPFAGAKPVSKAS
jgi:PAS domain S-box-containing protein